MKQKILFLCALCVLCATSHAQNRQDTLRLLQSTAGLLHLNITEAEADSMLDDIRGFTALYARMHQELPSNSLPYPFAFRPAPAGFKVPAGSARPQFTVPAGVQLPKERDDLAFYSVMELASLIKHRKITSVELTRFFMARLKKHNDSLQCVISFTEDLAMEQAAQADREIKAGRYRGPLHGIPYGLKDLFAVTGTRTTWGTTPYKDQVINDNSFVYEKLKGAGAVLCAKLSLGALAFNDLWFGGRTRNPWNLRQGSSGSSAGSASATSAGLLPFAIGTETWGSIISPSTRCGVTGLRPTFGAVSRSGAMVLSWSLDKVGPIARSAEDCAIVFAAIKGTDGEDPSAVEYPFAWNPAADVRKLKVAYAGNYFDRLSKESAEWKVLDAYKAMGVNLIRVELPDSAIYPFNIMDPVISAESAAAFDELTRTNRDELIERQDKGFWPNTFRGARYIPAVEYIQVNRHRSTLIERMNAFMKGFDVLITPTWSGNQSAITNLSGHPAICLPIGFRNGNALSITLLANLYDEASLLTAAKAFQKATDYHKQRPPLFIH